MRITDGTETVEIESVEIYAREYSFNEPGEVTCRVLNAYGEAAETFIIRSDDGRRGYLVTG